MPEFHAVGKVLPERLSFNLSKRELEVGGFPATIHIHQSRIIIEASPPEDINMWTLRNVLKMAAESQVDIHGFLEGRAFGVEITSIRKPSGETWLFEDEIPSLIDALDEEESEEFEKKILSIYENGIGEYLRRALRDYRLAIQDPGETGFACYRAIEALRKHIHDIEDIPDDDSHRNEGWTAMHDLIGTEKEAIIDIQQTYANERRHGGWVPISDEEREEVLLVTHDAICRYVDFCYDELI